MSKPVQYSSCAGAMLSDSSRDPDKALYDVCYQVNKVHHNLLRAVLVKCSGGDSRLTQIWDRVSDTIIHAQLYLGIKVFDTALKVTKYEGKDVKGGVTGQIGQYMSKAVRVFYDKSLVVMQFELKVLRDYAGYPYDRIISPIDLSDCPIHRLPSEVLSVVFSFSDIPAQQNGRLVCRQWNHYNRNVVFLGIARSGESWRSHQAVLDLARTIPRLRHLQRNLLIDRLRRSAFCVIENNVSLILFAIGRIWLKNIGNTKRAAINSMSNEERLAAMQDYNMSRVYVGDGEYRVRLPHEMATDPDFVIQMMLNEVFAICDFLPTAGLTIMTVIKIGITIDKVRDLWRLAPGECNQELKNRLSLPAKLSSDPVLSRYLCSVSRRVMLFPVEDGCAGHHLFDYLSIQDLTITDIHCPITNAVIPPENLRFRADIFTIVQNRLRALIEASDPLVRGLRFKPF